MSAQQTPQPSTSPAPPPQQSSHSYSPAALQALSTHTAKDPSKIMVRFKAIGSAPIMKNNNFRVTAFNKFQAVILFLRKELGSAPGGGSLVSAGKLGKVGKEHGEERDHKSNDVDQRSTSHACRCNDSSSTSTTPSRHHQTIQSATSSGALEQTAISSSTTLRRQHLVDSGGDLT